MPDPTEPKDGDRMRIGDIELIFERLGGWRMINDESRCMIDPLLSDALWQGLPIRRFTLTELPPP